MSCESNCISHGRDEKTSSMLEKIRHGHGACLPITQRDRHVLSTGDLGNFVAHEIDDGLKIKFRRQPLLHAVDNGELCGALFAFLEQALSLVEQARVLERDAHRVAERLQHPHVGFAVSVYLAAVERDHTVGFVALNDRNAEIALADLRRGGVAYLLATELRGALLKVFTDDQRSAGCDDVTS